MDTYILDPPCLNFEINVIKIYTKILYSIGKLNVDAISINDIKI